MAKATKEQDKGKGGGKGSAKGPGKGGGPAKGGVPGQAKGKATAKEEPKRLAKKGEIQIDPPPPSRLAQYYKDEVVPSLVKHFAYTSVMQVPRLQKVVVNMGVGDALQNAKLLDAAAADLEIIVGQKPAIRRAKKSISNFKLRAGVPIGCMVTLRGARMWEFMERLMTVAIPRLRDFRGLSPRSFDGRGNYTFGVKEQVMFTEIQYDKVEKIRGMDVTLVTSARNDEEGLELLKGLKWPFRLH
jgi:large subunit ribosomal protein L5